jgi:plastocyanin
MRFSSCHALTSDRAKVTFTSAGEYDYYCTIHVALGMVGKVIVNR